MTHFIYQLLITSLLCLISPAAQNDLTEIEYRSLAFDFELLLSNYLKEWQHLTETSKTVHIGEFFGKEWFAREYGRSCEILGTCGNKTNSCGGKNLYSDGHRPKDAVKKTTKKLIKEPKINIKTFYHQKSEERRWNTTTFLPGNEAEAERKEESELSDTNKGHEKTDKEPRKKRRRRRRNESNVPVFYMPGGPKKTRNCAMVNGLLGGFNTFNYLTFVTGIITLILNVNNNLNNNNNNNNLNNNNDISNNNVNANTNTQNANQVSS